MGAIVELEGGQFEAPIGAGPAASSFVDGRASVPSTVARAGRSLLAMPARRERPAWFQRGPRAGAPLVAPRMPRRAVPFFPLNRVADPRSRAQWWHVGPSPISSREVYSATTIQLVIRMPKEMHIIWPNDPICDAELILETSGNP